MIFKLRHWLAVAGTRYERQRAVIIAKERESWSAQASPPSPPPMSSQGRPVKPLKCPPFVPFQGTADYTGTAPVCSHHKRFFFLFLPLLSVHDLWKGGGGWMHCQIYHQIKGWHIWGALTEHDAVSNAVSVCVHVNNWKHCTSFISRRIYSHVTYKWIRYLDSWSHF